MRIVVEWNLKKKMYLLQIVSATSRRRHTMVISNNVKTQNILIRSI